MAIKTKIIWGEAGASDFAAKAAELTANGVTDGTSILEEGAIIRTWTTREAAQEWLDFLNSQTPVPLTADIVEE